MKKILLAVVAVLVLVSSALAFDADVFATMGCKVEANQYPWSLVTVGQRPIEVNADWLVLDLNHQNVAMLQPGEQYWVASRRDYYVASQPLEVQQQLQQQFQPVASPVATPPVVQDEWNQRWQQLKATVSDSGSAGAAPVAETVVTGAHTSTRAAAIFADRAEVLDEPFLWSTVVPKEGIKVDAKEFVVYEPGKSSQVKEMKSGKKYLVCGVEEYKNARPRNAREIKAFARPGTNVKVWADGGQQLYLAGAFRLDDKPFALEDGRQAYLVMNYQSPSNARKITVANSSSKSDSVFCTLKLEVDGGILAKVPD